MRRSIQILSIIGAIALLTTTLLGQREGIAGRWAAVGFGDDATRFRLALDPASNTQATVTQAAGTGGAINVADCISFSVTTGAVAPSATTVTINLRDGTSGNGTVLWAQDIVIPATALVNAVPPFSECGFRIPGSANTAMTLEFNAAGGANTFQTVALSGNTR